jgi:hypothetical protein
MVGREMYSNKKLENLISQQRKEIYSVALRGSLYCIGVLMAVRAPFSPFLSLIDKH